MKCSTRSSSGSGRDLMIPDTILLPRERCPLAGTRRRGYQAIASCAQVTRKKPGKGKRQAGNRHPVIASNGSWAKNQKPLSSKKPPEPNENHQLIEEWIANAKPALNPIVSKLDNIILQELKNPKYAIKWGKAYYGSTKFGWCIELVAYDVSVNVVFLNGSQLNEPPELGDETRYAKIRDLEELKSDQVPGWVKQSCQMPGWAW